MHICGGLEMELDIETNFLGLISVSYPIRTDSRESVLYE